MVLLLSASSSRDGQAPVQWPPVRAGLWELRSQRTLPNGTTQSWRTKSCRAASNLFHGYWGLGVVEKAGCRYEAIPVSAGRYRVRSRCVVRGVGESTGESIVTLHGDTAFDMDVLITEGSRRYRATQTGCRVATCTQNGSR